MSTYEKAVKSSGPDDPTALALYVWNAEVSGAFMAPLHICEVVIRNAVSDALEPMYGAKWPWAPGFEQSLPSPIVGYNARRDLFDARSKFTTTGKVIPELKFAFWQRMFTKRHDRRVWDRHLLTVFPGLDASRPVAGLRGGLYTDLEEIRALRNRIAHHEPIFVRKLEDDFDRIYRLVAARCKVTADWMVAHQQVTVLLKNRP